MYVSESTNTELAAGQCGVYCCQIHREKQTLRNYVKDASP
jgi:hypothetical protein